MEGNLRNIFKNCLNWYFRKDALPYWCILTIDTLIVIASYLFAYYCIIGGSGIISNFWAKMGVLLLCMIPYWVCFKVFHTYCNIIRYSTLNDLSKVVQATFWSSLTLIIIRLIFISDITEVYPSTKVIVYAFFFSTVAMSVMRYLVRWLYNFSKINRNAKPVFIYGCHSKSVALATNIGDEKPSKYVVRGFVSYGEEKQRKYIAGIKVYHDDVSLIGNMLSQGIEGLMVLPAQENVFRANERLINELTEAHITIYMVPDEQEWDGTKPKQCQLREVEVEDLLPRDVIEVDMEAIGELLKDKKILITGAAGSIGGEMVKQIAIYKPKEMVLVDQAETPMHDVRLLMANKFPDVESFTIVTSITNKTRMEAIFKEHTPDYVFHAAAYKHVPMMEDNPSEAIQNNVYGTRVIADLAVKYNTRKFVMISTDKAVNPTNVMGCSKRICEIYCQSLNAAIAEGKVKGITQFVTTRFGNVLGSNGSVIPLFREQIKKGGPVTVTHPDIIRYFMLIPEACKLVLQAGAFGKGGEIFVFDMGKPVRIADLAKRMIAMSNAKGVEIKFTGLRDGEKLFEEVLSDAERTIETTHPKIRTALVREYPYEEACRNEERLMDVSYTYDDMAVVKIMKEIVPEFKSRHSKYEALDEI